MEAQEEEADVMQQATTRTPEVPQLIKEKDELTLGDIMGRLPPERSQPLNSEDPVADKCLLQVIKENYERDPLTRSVLTKLANHKKYFHISDGLIWTKNPQDMEVICVPRENTLISYNATAGQGP